MIGFLKIYICTDSLISTIFIKVNKRRNYGIPWYCSDLQHVANMMTGKKGLVQRATRDLVYALDRLLFLISNKGSCI